MDLGIAGKVALVTGASAGIGAAIARRLDQIARRSEKLNEVREGLTGANAKQALIQVCDVTKAEEVSNAVSCTLERFGTIDILVNNAGGLTTGDLLPFDSLSDQTFIDNYALNVMSAVRFIRAVLPSMRQQHWGRIVSISSESAVQPDAEVPITTPPKRRLMRSRKPCPRRTRPKAFFSTW
jgi:3-oxoacyl-[acyl-carrier protein] reductase